MKYDWKYVNEERVRMNVALISSEVINDLASSNSVNAVGQIMGVCALMNAIMESLKEEEAGDEP